MLPSTIHVCVSVCVYDFTYSHYLLDVQQSPTAEADWPFVCPDRLIRSWSWNRRTPRAAEGGTTSSTSSTSSSSSAPRCRAAAPTDSWRHPHPPWIPAPPADPPSCTPAPEQMGLPPATFLFGGGRRALFLFLWEGWKAPSFPETENHCVKRLGENGSERSLRLKREPCFALNSLR